ncbi:MAG: DUF554 domain-containing protein [Desulfitobacteriia bacterium]
MLGTIVNFFAIIFGGLIGLLFGRIIPEKLKNTIIQGIALVVILIGLQMALKTENFLLIIASLLLGGLIGEVLDIEACLYKAGNWLEKKLSGFFEQNNFPKAFVTASLIYCVGAMAIVGALEGGLNANHSILFAKSALDGITAIVFAASMGSGVIFSAIPVLLYQGSIAILAGFLQGVFSDLLILEMSAVGGLLILGIGINLLEIKEIKIGNLLPAIFILIPLFFLSSF